MTSGPEQLERLSSDDDLATRREEEFRAAALRQAARRVEQAQPGTCANCGAACLPQAVYCDPDCRADHEARRLRAARQGLPR